MYSIEDDHTGLSLVSLESQIRCFIEEEEAWHIKNIKKQVRYQWSWCIVASNSLYWHERTIWKWIIRIPGTVAYMWPPKLLASLQAHDIARYRDSGRVGHSFGKPCSLAWRPHLWFSRKLVARRFLIRLKFNRQETTLYKKTLASIYRSFYRRFYRSSS